MTGRLPWGRSNSAYAKAAAPAGKYEHSIGTIGTGINMQPTFAISLPAALALSLAISHVLSIALVKLS